MTSRVFWSLKYSAGIILTEREATWNLQVDSSYQLPVCLGSNVISTRYASSETHFQAGSCAFLWLMFMIECSMVT